MTGQSIHAHMSERIGLAEAYAEDGAFHSAARVLRGLADDLSEHARKADLFVEAMIAQGKCQPEGEEGAS